MLIFTLKNERQSRVVRHEDGPIEFGRGPERELPRVIIEDRYTSRDQLRAEETPTGDVRITSLGSTPITLADGTQLNQGESRNMMAPAQFSFGYTTLLIGVIPKETDQFASSLHTISPPSRTRSQNVTSLKRPAQADAPTPEMLTEWFERLLHVQKAAAGSDEFYQQTAQAVVEIIGLDRGMILLRAGSDWKVVAHHTTLADGTSKFSRRVIDEVVSKRSTFFQMYTGGNHEGSLTMVDAIVASPIIDQEDSVVGIVYGSRDMRTLTLAGQRGIQPLEAQFMQVLAGAVSAGLARCAKEAEVARARAQFEQFVSPELAKALERDPGILAAKERELTLLFADLRGFSRIAERIGAEQTYDLLSDILDRLTNQIMDHGGVVIDYYGDGLAAMWNAPFDQADHAERAIHAAQAMQHELPAINVTWAERLGGLIRIGIGINTGFSQVGNSGSRRRMKYGPRGHAVNLASRVEAATKKLGVPCLITESTRERLGPNAPVRRLCRARLTGMDSAINLYELPGEDRVESWLAQCELYEQALALYEQDRASDCLALIERLQQTVGAHDEPTKKLREHAELRLAEPNSSFDSVIALETK